MKKLLIALLVILLLVVGGVMVVASQAGSLIRSAVVEYGPQITGTTITLDDVSLSLMNGHAKIKGLAVGNPQGFSAEHIAKVGEVELKLDVNSLFGNDIRINKILVDGAELTYEPGSKGSNIDVLKREIEKRTAALVGDSQSAEEQSQESTKALVIDDLYVNNTKINVVTKLLAGKGASLTIPDIHMEDIGKDEGGASAADVINELVAIITQSATKGVGELISPEQLKEALDKNVSDKVKGVSDKLKGLFGR